MARVMRFLFGTGREAQARTLLLEHLEKVGHCVARSRVVLEDYLAGRIEEAKTGAIEVDHLETDADNTRRAVIDLLYRGAFLPIVRPDLHDWVEHADLIADAAENTCDFLLGQRPEIPAEYAEPMRQIYQHTVEMFSVLQEAVVNFFAAADEGLIRDRLKTVGVIESTIDDIEWKLTRQIFTSPLAIGARIHLKGFLETLTEISDDIEDAGDRLEVLLLGLKI
ncbi:MAG: DUF47 family protein [Armatimonadota bacterium]|nr:DUF47 family protein [Armatimonadota bacterium]MDR7466275.1 DUF47 family protein [Armatimonadota bacterium]MDR7492996.1 DUF47 family protein [Armatimonadota bacterium]MDR7503712.1 DUF47 family protein [Armatimonadota bacterium]MDR7545964.1 DUF47 family protein [Armatimonadota bacterium]